MATRPMVQSVLLYRSVKFEASFLYFLLYVQRFVLCILHKILDINIVDYYSSILVRLTQISYPFRNLVFFIVYFMSMGEPQEVVYLFILNMSLGIVLLM